MKKSNTCFAILVAGLLAAAGAQAQSAAPGGNSDGPPAAGEASNQTRGVPNAKTTNSPVSEAPIPLSRTDVIVDSRTMGASGATVTSLGGISARDELLSRRSRFLAWGVANGTGGRPQ